MAPMVILSDLMTWPELAVDPGDSTAATLGDLVTDYNTLLANLRTAGIL
jgi:hypothetical protein